MQSTFDKDLIKIEGYFTYKLFPKNNPSDWSDGVYCITKWEVENVLQGTMEEALQVNFGITTFKEITITGVFYEPLKLNTKYSVLLKKTEHPTYGTQYNLIYINEQIDLCKIKNQQAFLSSFLTDKQIEELYKVHDNPLKIIDEHNIEELKKVHGIGEEVAKKIIDRYEDKKDLSNVYIELDGYGLTPNFIHKLTEQYSSPAQLISIVKNHPYKLISDIEGVGFKTADEIALKGGLSPKSVERIEAYIVYYLNNEAVDNGNSYVTAGELMNNIVFFFGGKDQIIEEYHNSEGEVTGTNISVAIQHLKESSKIVVENNENKSLRRVYLTYYYNLEKEIVFHLKRLLQAPNKFDFSDWKDKIKKLEKKQGYDFDETQLKGIELGLNKQVCLICGLAGAGKSSLVAGILAGLDQYSFAQCALSGKAAARLQEVTGETGSTIHRLLGYDVSRGFYYNEDNTLTQDIIILDEVSLVGGEIFLSLIKAIPTGSKLIMLGDLGQLGAIGALNLATDFYESPVIPTVELKTIHRQAAQSGIVTTAHKVRNQEQIFDNDYEGLLDLGELKDMTLDISLQKDVIRQKVLNWFEKNNYGDIMKIQVISPTKERGDACVYNLNNDIQKIVNPIKRGDRELIIGTTEKPYNIHKGDKVMCVKNNYSVKVTKQENQDGKTILKEESSAIFNGWVGIIEDIDDETILIDFPLAGGLVSLNYKQAKDSLVLGYVSTVHKLQGSDAPIVIGVIDYSTPPSMLNCQLLYTLITRAKRRCILVGQSKAVRQAVLTNFISQKRTFMQELLAQNN